MIAKVEKILGIAPEAPKFVRRADGRPYPTVAEMFGKREGIVTLCTVVGTGCCGVLEIRNMSALNSPGEVLIAVGKQLDGIPNWPYEGSKGTTMGNRGYDVPHVLFTGITKIGEKKSNHVSKFNPTTKLTEVNLDVTYWQSFIDYLKKHSLGSIWEGPRKENSCYGNEVGVFIWNPDYPSFKKWIASHVEAVKIDPKVPKDADGANVYNPYPTRATEIKLKSLD